MFKLDNGCLRVNLLVINSPLNIIYCLRELLREYLNFPVVLQHCFYCQKKPDIEMFLCVIFLRFFVCFLAWLLRLAIVRFAGNLSLAIVLRTQRRRRSIVVIICRSLLANLLIGLLHIHTHNTQCGPNFPVKCIQQILCSCQFDKRFPTQPESIYKGMCVCVCVCT